MKYKGLKGYMNLTEYELCDVHETNRIKAVGISIYKYLRNVIYFNKKRKIIDD